ncbi:hypothetical protein [Corynebacterium sputi]|uniref:hypothetical protein n=1 Tax=Corynebacterium sputi TaxID=489915 RepID=UPI0012EC07D5|nr:hypothetical protein [Corynebacterium sputi]
MDGNEVTVVDGEVNCAEGRLIMEKYLNTPVNIDGGNTNFQELGDWTCSMPTAARSAELGLAAVCDLPDSGRVGVAP